ncbi:unnamed protein product [Cladocopium goreaui]|uniref:Peroxin-5 n=1 Tax=Cladocopium goreaui TaxID=2562237 RepID=A0A9P1M571_9DINO|nr:unnamed protein product [Cladocopium goreaui]
MTAQHQQFQAEQEQLNGKLSASDRKAKMLEAKLKGRIESMRVMQAEKEAVEEQLRIAAKQLEALLADETKDSDLQRDLAALSKQFEQLHAKHRIQLAQAEEHAKQLKHEQAAYAELHEEFAQQQLIASEEREALSKELADLSADASQVRQQCNELNHHKEEPSNGHGGPQEQTLAGLERDFAEFARSVGFKGDVSQLWEEAQAAAAKEAEKASVQKARRDERPVAADVQLRPSADSGDVPSPPRRGVPWKSSGAGVTPKEQETTSSKSVLPLAAQECFQQAEALCARQRFSEAVPLFRRTLEILQDASGSGSCAAAAEVWAHLGVAMQSLDRVPEAIDSYRRAVAMDAGLHVCFANLATLHAYLHEKEQALKYIAKALEVEPTNPTYLALRSQFLTEPKEESQSTKEESTSAPLGDQSSLGESSEPANELASTEGSKKSTSRMS